MQKSPDIDEFADIFDLMSKKYRMSISRYDHPYLMSTLEKRLKALSIDSIKKYSDFISNNEGETKKLFDSLLNNHSKFFRNTLTFSLLGHWVLPLIVEEKERSRNKEIRIWSAGCAAGQEAYSIAILLDRILSTREQQIPYRIFATDISEAYLTRAKNGSYSLKDVENVQLKYLNRYFTIDNKKYLISPQLKKHIDFSFYDLFDKRSVCPPVSIYGEFDIVVLSNVLYYYRPEMQQRIINKILKCLSDGKYLVTGKTEKSIIEETGLFYTVAEPISVYKKLNKEGSQ